MHNERRRFCFVSFRRLVWILSCFSLLFLDEFFFCFMLKFFTLFPIRYAQVWRIHDAIPRTYFNWIFCYYFGMISTCRFLHRIVRWLIVKMIFKSNYWHYNISNNIPYVSKVCYEFLQLNYITQTTTFVGIWCVVAADCNKWTPVWFVGITHFIYIFFLWKHMFSRIKKGDVIFCQLRSNAFWIYKWIMITEKKYNFGPFSSNWYSLWFV